MDKNIKDTEKNEAIRQAASILGRLGGKAGTGDAKRRPSEVMRAAVMKRWEAYRKRKEEAAKKA
jgi:hypothetical protein